MLKVKFLKSNLLAKSELLWNLEIFSLDWETLVLQSFTDSILSIVLMWFKPDIYILINFRKAHLSVYSFIGVSTVCTLCSRHLYPIWAAAIWIIFFAIQEIVLRDLNTSRLESKDGISCCKTPNRSDEDSCVECHYSKHGKVRGKHLNKGNDCLSNTLESLWLTSCFYHYSGLSFHCCLNNA